MEKSLYIELYRKARDLKWASDFPYSRYNKINNCIFIHIPRVAGTSIVNALGGAKAKRNHLPWYVYYTANKNFFRNAFKFSFVRNPWDRTLSAYQYLVRGGNQKSDRDVASSLTKYNDFEDFVINGLGQGYYRNHLLFLPQSDFIVTGEQELAVDFLGCFESIDDSFEKILNHLDLNIKLEKKNSSVREKNYREYYRSDKSIKIVEDIYKQDVNFFSYKY